MGRLLRESGVDYEKVDYFVEPLGEERLRRLIEKMGVSPRELLRTSERVYRELNLGGREMSDDDLIHLMAEHPSLIQRPIIERGDRAVLGRPAERVRELL